MIYEVRDYHYRTDKFDEYKAWAVEAVPVLKSKLDIVGFWIDAGIEPRFGVQIPWIRRSVRRT